MATITAAEAGGANLVAYLDLIAFSEGTSTSPHTLHDGYDVIVSGVDGWHDFEDFRDDPFSLGRPPIEIHREPLLESTAAGRYQLLARYWPHYRDLLHLPDFGPLSQDKVALQQIKERGAVADILAGDIAAAIGKCSNIWASFPGNGYGQGGKELGLLLDHFHALAAA
jgi:muramidase (phage lysozyme)